MIVKFYFIAFLILTIMSCNKPENVTVGIHIEGAAADAKPIIVTSDSTYELTLDSAGMATVVIAKVATPVEATFKCGRMRIPLYLEADKNFEISYNEKDRKSMPVFSGEGALKNDVLNGKYFKADFVPEFSLEEQAFITSIEDQIKSYNSVLDSLALDQPFTNLLKDKLKYRTLSVLGMYPSYHAWKLKLEDYTASDVYSNYLKSLIVEDEALLKLAEYKSALASFVSAYATKDIKEYDALQNVQAKLDYVSNNITNPKIAEFLVDKYTTDFVSSVGVDNLDVVSGVYNAKVTDPELKSKFDALCAEWAKIAKGQPSPGFKYLNIDGKEVALEDLAGKYIYVDVWATWCGPCRGEIPSLKELEHQFKGKNINFVSISCDQDKAAWEKMVKEEKLGGIQLHNGGDQAFMEAYMIRGIPRFILIDREGKIVSCDMTRPSNPKTIETFNALEGI